MTLWPTIRNHSIIILANDTTVISLISSKYKLVYRREVHTQAVLCLKNNFILIVDDFRGNRASINHIRGKQAQLQVPGYLIKPVLHNIPFGPQAWLNLTHHPSKYKEDIYHVLALRWWNELSLALQTAESLAVFTQTLNSDLFPKHLNEHQLQRNKVK